MLQHTRKFRRVFIATILASSFFLGVAPARKVRAATSVEKLQEFGLDQVQITDEYQKNLFTLDTTYLIKTLNSKTLDTDRLLAGFKAMAAGTNPTNLYGGGWEDSLIRGHTMGHWLSAVAHAYQQALGSDATLAGQIKTKLDDVIAKLKSYQQSNGFLFATPMSQFDDMDNGTGNSWVPYYTMHKILAGLIDVYKYEQNADALTMATELGDWLYSRAMGWSASAKSRVLGSEYGGMNDALYELYKLTNSANHLTVAHIFDDTGMFTPIAAGQDTLNSSVHANMTIPKFIGALNRYRTVGTSESSYLNAASGFLSVVLKDHTYVTGGNSEDEHFHEPGVLDKYRDNINNETCNAYNMSKLTRDLFRTTGDVKYADYYEKVHINEILSSMNPETGMTTYFKAMGTGYFKAYGTPDASFWCCTGTGMENFTKLNDSLYFHDDKDLWVTFYLSSNLNWKDRGLSLTQTTDLPLTNKVTITITAAPTDAVNLNFRKPAWTSTCQMAISVNGQVVTPVESNGFLGVSRVWQANDKVELAFPLLVQVSRLQDNQNAVAFTYGPLVLSAGLGGDAATLPIGSHGVGIRVATLSAGLQDTITINSGTKIEDWLSNIQTNLVQTAGKLEFTPKGTDSDSKLVFIPHYSRYKDRYGIYWKLSGTAGGTATTAVTCPNVTPSGSGGAGGSSGGSGGSTGGGGAAGNSGKGGAGGNGGAVSTGSGGTTGVTSKGGAGGTNTGAGGTNTGAGGATAGTGGTTGGSGGSTKGSGGGAQSSGGVASVGGAAGGSAHAGGATAGLGGNANGGTSHSEGGAGGGSTGSATGGTAGSTGGAAGQNSTGCSCNLGHTTSTGHWLIGLLLGLGLVARRRSRRR